MLYAFDLRPQDLRALPLGDRKKRLRRLLGKRRLGIVISEHTRRHVMLGLRSATTGIGAYPKSLICRHK
jgi:hypothetical protein